MIRRPPRSTRTDTLFPYTTLFRSARRLMNADRSQPDGGLFELLVALAYYRDGWETAFAPERPGVAKTHDPNVRKGRSRWAVECKRMDRSSYEARERENGRAAGRERWGSECRYRWEPDK